ncbi:MAG: hypothetical protein GY829_10640 [Gammaproteobacteria bacterium]|nr:hypothetical protein [Gammaproteobacteria bacterium]
MGKKLTIGDVAKVGNHNGAFYVLRKGYDFELGRFNNSKSNNNFGVVMKAGHGSKVNHVYTVINNAHCIGTFKNRAKGTGASAYITANDIADLVISD